MVQLYEISDRGTKIFPETPTMNYIQPKESHGVCGLVAITNDCENVQYLDVGQFINVVATQRGKNAEIE